MLPLDFDFEFDFEFELFELAWSFFALGVLCSQPVLASSANADAVLTLVLSLVLSISPTSGSVAAQKADVSFGKLWFHPVCPSLDDDDDDDNDNDDENKDPPRSLTPISRCRCRCRRLKRACVPKVKVEVSDSQQQQSFLRNAALDVPHTRTQQNVTPFSLDNMLDQPAQCSACVNVFRSL